MIVEKQGGLHYTVTTYPAHHFDTHSVCRSHEVKVVPVVSKTNQMSISMNMPVHQSLISPAGQNLFGTANVHPLGLVQNHVSAAPASSAVVGTTELRYVFKHPMFYPFIPLGIETIFAHAHIYVAAELNQICSVGMLHR